MKDRKKATLVLPLCSWHTPNTLASDVIDGKTNERTNERTSEWRQKQAAASISSLNGGVGGKYDKRLYWVNLHKAHIHIQQMSHKLKKNQRREEKRWLAIGTSRSSASGQVSAQGPEWQIDFAEKWFVHDQMKIGNEQEAGEIRTVMFEGWKKKEGENGMHTHTYTFIKMDDLHFARVFSVSISSCSSSPFLSLSPSLSSSSSPSPSLSSSSCSRLSFPRLLWPEYSDWQKTHTHRDWRANERTNAGAREKKQNLRKDCNEYIRYEKDLVCPTSDSLGYFAIQGDFFSHFHINRFICQSKVKKIGSSDTSRNERKTTRSSWLTGCCQFFQSERRMQPQINSVTNGWQGNDRMKMTCCYTTTTVPGGCWWEWETTKNISLACQLKSSRSIASLFFSLLSSRLPLTRLSRGRKKATSTIIIDLKIERTNQWMETIDHARFFY